MGLAAAASLAFAGSASAQTQDVTATAAPALALTVPGPVTFTTLQHGANTFPATPLAVVAPLGSWGLTVADATNEGVLQAAATGCTSSDPDLVNPLTFGAAVAIDTDEGLTGTVAAAAADVVTTASSLADTVNVTYSVDVPATQQMETGCVYSTQLSYTLTG